MRLPKGEKAWVSYQDFSGKEKFIITSKTNSRDTYYLYEVTPDGLVKLGKGSSPTQLELKFKVKEKVRAVKDKKSKNKAKSS